MTVAAAPCARAVELLEEAGLVSSSERVAGLVMASDLSRSNSNVEVVTPNASFFVKLGKAGDRTAATLGPGKEIEMLRTLRAIRPNVLPWLPTVIHASTSEPALVLPMMPMRSLRAEEIDKVIPSDETFRRIGAALACFHGAPSEDPEGLQFGRSRCGYHLEPEWTDVLENAHCYRRTIEIIAGSDAISSGLREVDERWTPQTPIHGDLRWDNLLVQVDDANDLPSFSFIDLETVVHGDPRWDVACFLADSMSSWIRRGATFAGWDRSVKRRELALIRPPYQRAARHFLDGYRSSEQTGTYDEDLVVKMVAARLIQTAIEAAVKTRDITQSIVDHLQISENMFKAPATLGVEVLGIQNAP